MSDPLTTPERAPDPHPTPEPVREARHIVATLKEYKRIGAAVFGVVTALGGAGAYVYPWGEADPVAAKVEAQGARLASVETSVAVQAETLKHTQKALDRLEVVLANVETLMREVSIPERKIRKAPKP